MVYDDVKPDNPSRSPGRAGEGSSTVPLKDRMTRKANDSTGINVADRKPISPEMPHLPPA